jgi:hypothetical protein
MRRDEQTAIERLLMNRLSLAARIARLRPTYIYECVSTHVHICDGG